MDDVQVMIYNELRELKEEFGKYADKMEIRVSSLEKFKNYVAGIALVVGFTVRCGWDYIKERLLG